MDNLRICKVKNGYVKYLNSIDSRVLHNKDRRPYVGIVLTIGTHQYFVPMESPKPNHQNVKSNVHIMWIEGGKYGLLGFNNMIPAKPHHLVEFDIEKETDTTYKELLRNQLAFLRAHKTDICEHAQKTYDKVTVEKVPFFIKICCDFNLLEQEYTKYYVKTTMNS